MDVSPKRSASRSSGSGTASRVARILESYGLEASRIEPLESADNQVFKIESEDGRCFLLRVRHGFDPADEASAHARIEFAWLEHIRSTTDLLVPQPVRLAGGERSGTIDLDDRERVFVLFEWIDGEPASGALDSETCRRMGRAIAQLHWSSRELAPALELCRVRWDEPTFFGPDSWLGRGQAESDLDSRRFELVANAAKGVRSVMEGLARSPDHFGLIHSDTHPGNMLVSQGDIAILDFNDCGWGHYLLDLGVMLHDLEFELKDRPGEYPELGQAVLSGYEEVAPLPAAQPAQLPAFVALRSISSLAWIARSPDPDERREALRSRPGVPFLFQQLDRFLIRPSGP